MSEAFLTRYKRPKIHRKEKRIGEGREKRKREKTKKTSVPNVFAPSTLEIVRYIVVPKKIPRNKIVSFRRYRKVARSFVQLSFSSHELLFCIWLCMFVFSPAHFFNYLRTPSLLIYNEVPNFHYGLFNYPCH